MRFIGVTPFLIVGFLLSGCDYSLKESVSAIGSSLATPTPQASASPSPLPPITPTPSITPTATPKPTTPTPTATPVVGSTPNPPCGTDGVISGIAGMKIGPQVTTFTASGALKPKTGDIITGLKISNPSGDCIDLTGVNNVQIYNNKIGPCGNNGINAYNSYNIKIHHNHIEDVASAAYLAATSGGGIQFYNNYATKVHGPMPRGQMIQLNEVNGPGTRITCNVSNQKLGGYVTGPEDHVNIFKSNGTQASPINVQYNKVCGGGSASGGGLLIGDYGGSWSTIQDNVAVNSGQYGIAIAGGTNQKILRNKVYSAQFPWSNNGMFIWNQGTPLPACDNDVIQNNKVNYTHRDGYKNAGWNGGGCTNVTMTNNNWDDASVTAAAWDTVWSECNNVD